MATEREEIAIIGTGCRFSGAANSPSKLWTLLRDPRPVASKVPAIKGFYHELGQYHGHANVKEAYLLEGESTHRRFDATFFGISPIEAKQMDPQIRMLLETVYEALEAGGQSIDTLRGSDTAVYAGQMVNDYELVMLRDQDTLGKYHATGTSRAMLSNRVSYFFDWNGPSMTIDTACSSSLVALHHAVQQLRSGRSRVAVVAGANLIFDFGTFIAESNLQMLSPEGRSRMWDADANGYARGEGIAAIVLKTRTAAEADQDFIECLIRETSVNQDGKTPGPTMPSASAQARLIRDCYTRAGLDLRNPADRPQFFEAHGTGTPAGDPIEAEAISSAFFPDEEITRDPLIQNPLFVGSIKTIVGHTEGAAGLAGLIKASLCLQNAEIPPNLHFDHLNPRVEPFYTNLRIPTSLTPWPTIPGSWRRRVSVNSFGFGGTNAHAILESYTPSTRLLQQPNPPTFTSTVLIPFVFSAASEASLKSYLANFLDFMREMKPLPDLRDIAYTLDARRSHLPVATAIGASSAEELCQEIESKLELSRLAGAQNVGVKIVRQVAEAGKPRILGIFTGQGAQWPQMGFDLVAKSPACRSILERLQRHLDQLPVADQPSWSLLEQLEKGPASSRVMEATISLPLCTAIQILQVELLRAADIEFAAVVGHSSGEIAAAYAAGQISAEDAIRIAYYRGLCSGLAQSPTGQRGAMMAVGTADSDAQDLLDYPEFQGRVCVAAVNSATSVTLSGDQDAIEEVKVVFEDEKKFVRRLKVDKAYHSHHMRACSATYLDSLAALDIQTGSHSQVCWFSSVWGSQIDDDCDLLKGPYWETNMVNPVLFEKAVDAACSSMRAVDLVIEVGPHPALKGPALETIQSRIPHTVPYTGLFHRGASAIASIADGLGYAWTHLGKDAINLQGYDSFVSGNSSFRPATGLPSYVWDHDHEHWSESRYARAVRLRQDSVNELLGHATPDSTEHDMRWRQILRVSEIPWLADHRLQGTIVFPAAGYIVSVLEAALLLCNDASVALIELVGIEFDAAMMFSHDDSEIEAIISLSNISRKGEEAIEAEFKYHASSGKATDSLELKASGMVHVHLGRPYDTMLPSRTLRPSNLVPIRDGKFYDACSELEYQYSGQFSSLVRLERKLGAATGCISVVEPTSHLIHPGALDAAFQTTFLTYASPGDGAQKSMHIPRRIGRISVNPELCGRARDEQLNLAVDAVHPRELPHTNMYSDIAIYPDGLDHAMLVIDEAECVPFSQPTASSDEEIFAQLVWDGAEPDARLEACDNSIMPDHLELTTLLDRVASFYLRRLDRGTPVGHPNRQAVPYKHLLEFASRPPLLLPHWEKDTQEVITVACEPFSDHIDMKLLSGLGENLAVIAEGDKPALDVAMSADVMRSWYANGLRISGFTKHLARMARQLTHRYPRMHVLEFGPQMGSITPIILQEMGSKFASYTIASPTIDPSHPLPTSNDKVIARPLNLSDDPANQGFSAASYDLIVICLALHTAPDLAQTLRNARSLLRPGGYVFVLEIVPTASSFFGIVFGAFPDWWLGAEKRRTSSSAIPPTNWDSLLRETGFSGIDTSTPVEHDTAFSVFVSQAVDDRIGFIRDPLSRPFPARAKEPPVRDLLILGGDDRKTMNLSDQLSNIIEPHCQTIRSVQSFAELLRVEISPDTTILNLAGLDGSIFREIKATTWEGVRKLVSHAGNLTWVTQGRRADNPYANMALGLLRGATRDNPALDYLLLDFEDATHVDGRIIVESLLRHKVASLWRQQDDIHLTIENELVVDKTGRFLIARFIMNDEMNRRYNSNARMIHSPVQPGLQNLALSRSGSNWTIQSNPTPHAQGGESRRFLTTHSILSPVRVAEFGCMFVVLGKDDLSADRILTLSSENSSLVCPRKELSIPVAVSSGHEAQLLWLVANHLIASVILAGLSTDDQVLVYEPGSQLAAILDEEGARLGVRITFMTADATNFEGRDNKWLKIHPFAPERSISRLARVGFSVFVDMSTPTNIDSIARRIASMLPLNCRKENIKSLFEEKSWNPTVSQTRDLHTRLARAVASASASIAKSAELPRENISTTTIGVVSESSDNPGPLTVVEWATCSEVPLRIQPIDTQISLPNNKTYWLVGLTGGLGLSLCEWMAKRGARYFVICSRNPNVETAWLNEMRSRQVQVKIASCDVTNRNEVVALHEEICSTMPPIAGVAQGVMVLQDTSIQSMTIEQLLAVTQPKVEGSVHLNDLFQENTLDFFVFFGSSAVIGNYGQANYAAANSFMSALAEQRRRRGLAVSIIDIGPILGVGYVNRTIEGTIMSSIALQAGGFAVQCERDFHQLFGEAILAGLSGSISPIELFTGVRKISRRDEHRPVWDSWPHMSHYVQDGPETEDSAANGAHADLPIKTRLANAQTRDQVYDIIWDAFSLKVASQFQLDISKISRADLSAMRFDEIGIDSLAAVEIRGWFMRSLQIKISVLKVLNGVSVGELVATATESISPEIAPKLVDFSPEKAESWASATSEERLQDQTADTSDSNDPSDDTSSQATLSSTRDTMTDTSAQQVVIKSVPVSFTQSRFYPSGIFLEDRVGLNHTAWASISGKLDVARLEKAVRSLGEQHEILRTAFFDQDGRQMQHILATGVLHLEQQQIESEEQVAEIAMGLQKGHIYDVARGETIRMILLTRSEGQNYVVMGVHPLVLDATSLLGMLRWLSFHYSYPNKTARVKQFVEASEERHADYAAGRFETELRYWRSEFATPPPPMPLLSLAKVEERPNLKAYENIRASCTISADTKERILQLCRRIRVTPFHFYLAALRALLLRYTVGGEDITMAVAESGRGYDHEEMDVLGPLYNLVLVRLLCQTTTRFEDLLQAAREKTYGGLANSKLPYPMLVKELDLQRRAKYFPFFQVFVDYRTGQSRTMPLGEDNAIHMMGFDLNVPYDVYLDTIDEPNGECSHEFFVRKDLFSEAAAEELASSYGRIVTAFASQPGVLIGEADMSAPGK